MPVLRLHPVAAGLLAGAFALGLAAMPEWVVEGRLTSASCGYENSGREWTSSVTFTIQPDRVGRPLIFKTNAAPGSCDWAGYGRRIAHTWAYFAPDAPIRVTFRAFEDPLEPLPPGAGVGTILLRQVRVQFLTGIELNGRTVNWGWWGGA